ncbi:hypothetical protein [Flavobacterium xanthum]|nr:hypothetical protein [Flavobacterium xanthum]
MSLGGIIFVMIVGEGGIGNKDAARCLFLCHFFDNAGNRKGIKL